MLTFFPLFVNYSNNVVVPQHPSVVIDYYFQTVMNSLILNRLNVVQSNAVIVLINVEASQLFG